MNINNLMMNNSISYKIISANQKIENDKERIKSKFNFNITRSSTNSSAIKRSSLPTQQNSIITTNKNLKINDNICQNNDKKNKKNISNKSSNKFKQNNIKENKKFINSFHANNNKKDKMNIKTNENFNNINYNYYTSNDNSNYIHEHHKNFFQDSILHTQSYNEDIINQNYNNIYDNKNINSNIKKDDENNEKIIPEKDTSESFKKSSFSCSSKTSEMHNDILNIKTGNESESNIEIVNNENYIIKNYNGINNRNSLQNKKEEEEEIVQLYKPFINDNSERRMTEVNIMGLLDDDEYNQENRKKMLNNINKYIFIDDIIEKNNNFESLSFDKFKTISNKAKYKIFLFCYDNYKNIMNSSIHIRNLILSVLEERFRPCINDFSNKYKNILLIDSYKFNIHEFIKPKLKKKKFQTFCLYIKAKVLPNNEYFIKFGDVGFEISYKYKINFAKTISNNKSNITTISIRSNNSRYITEEYIQIYKFDLRKNLNFPMWLSSERDEIFNCSSRSINCLISKVLKKDELYQKHLIYSSPVINVNENDYIIFRIELIVNNSIVEDILFNEPIVQSINKNYFHKASYKQSQKFDKMRDCENELSINVWHDDYTINEYIGNNEKYKDFLSKLKKIFQEYFDIIETKYDISKFVFIRMTLKAKKIGVLKANIFSNKDIEIIDKNSPLTKECVPINFVNTFSLNKNLKIKIGTKIDFYLIE